MNETLPAAPDKRYESQKDGWIVALLWLVIVTGLAGGAFTLFTGDSWPVRLLMAGLMFGMAAFTWSVLRATDYTLTGRELKVRSGPIRWTIALDKIVEVRPTRQLWSSAALSVDRLQIRQQGEKLGSYISPLDREAFLADLAGRAPQLVRDGERLVAGQ